MAQVKTAFVDRPHRAAVPILVTFESASFTVLDFTLDLSVGGIFLLTENSCPWGIEGDLKFRSSQFEDPFTLRGRVVRIVSSEEAGPGRPAGLGIEFVEVSDEHRKKLQKIASGLQSGHVVESIRAAVREGNRSLDEELRRRPVDHKLMLAINARHEEIRALIRDANPTVMIRLLGSPRLLPAHVLQMLRHRNLPTRVLTAIYRTISRETTDEVRWSFVTHPNAMFSEVLSEMEKLSGSDLKRLALDPNVRQDVKLKARQLASRR